LRLQAWLAGDRFETLQLTPNYLAQLARSHCPVTGEAGTAQRPLQLCRINRQAGYAAGNLAALGARAAAALDGAEDLSAGEWQRLRLLQSFVTPLAHEAAACLPLLLLPPNRLRMLNAIQGLQALVTLQLGGERWGARIAPLVEALPDAATRRDFQLFFHSLMARLLEGGRETDPQRLRLRMESAWLDRGLQARWQRFALRLDADAAEALLQRASLQPLPSTGLLWHAPDIATDGWGPGGGTLPRPVSGKSDPVRQFRRRQVRQMVEAD
jgi:hypothetical protein